MSMPVLVKVVISPRQSGYIAKEDLQKFLTDTFGSGIDFKLRVSAASRYVV